MLLPQNLSPVPLHSGQGISPVPRHAGQSFLWEKQTLELTFLRPLHSGQVASPLKNPEDGYRRLEIEKRAFKKGVDPGSGLFPGPESGKLLKMADGRQS